MPRTRVVFLKEDTRDVPALYWLDSLREMDARAYAKCVVRIRRLSEVGHEIRRPEADYLRDGIYELRARRGRVHHRLLYFYYGRGVAVLAHGTTKERKVRDDDIEKALRRKEAFERNPEVHSLETSE